MSKKLTPEQVAKQQRIKKEYEELLEALEQARAEVKIAIARLDGLQSRCTHPHKYADPHQGERGYRCPDCGWSR